MFKTIFSYTNLGVKFYHMSVHIIQSELKSIQFNTQHQRFMSTFGHKGTLLQSFVPAQPHSKVATYEFGDIPQIYFQQASNLWFNRSNIGVGVTTSYKDRNNQRHINSSVIKENKNLQTTSLKQSFKSVLKQAKIFIQLLSNISS